MHIKGNKGKWSMDMKGKRKSGLWYEGIEVLKVVYVYEGVEGKVLKVVNVYAGKKGK